MRVFHVILHLISCFELLIVIMAWLSLCFFVKMQNWSGGLLKILIHLPQGFHFRLFCHFYHVILHTRPVLIFIAQPNQQIEYPIYCPFLNIGYSVNIVFKTIDYRAILNHRRLVYYLPSWLLPIKCWLRDACLILSLFSRKIR